MFRRALVRSLASKSSTAAAASAPRSILPPVTRFSVVTNFNKSLPNSARAPPPPPPPPHASLTNPTHFHPHPSPRCRIDGPLPGRFSDDEIFVSLPVRVRDHAPLGVTFKVDIEGRLELGAGGCGKAAEVGVGRKTVIALGGDPERKWQEVVVNGVVVVAEVLEDGDAERNLLGRAWVGRKKAGVVVDCGEWMVELKRLGGEKGEVGVEMVWK